MIERKEAGAPRPPIDTDDFRMEPLTPGIDLHGGDGWLYRGTLRTCAWNTPAEITLEEALAASGLRPDFWKIQRVTAHMWDDPGQGGSVIAYEFQIVERDTDAVAR